LVKDETEQETEGADETVHTSPELVSVRSLLSAKVPVKEVEAPLTNSTLTAPTAGTVTKAATVSMLVSIFRPAVVVAGTAPLAASVRPVHVTVTAPAARVDVESRVIVIASVAYADLPAAVVGDVMAHLSAVAAVTCPAGKVRVTLLSVA